MSPFPIYNPYFRRPKPVPPPRLNCVTNQPLTQSASSPLLPAPVPPIMNPDHTPSYSISHSSVHPPDHTSAYQPDNSSAQPPRAPPTHLQHHPQNHSSNPETKDSPHSPAIDVLEQKQPDQKEIDIVQRIQNSVM